MHTWWWCWLHALCIMVCIVPILGQVFKISLSQASSNNTSQEVYFFYLGSSIQKIYRSSFIKQHIVKRLSPSISYECFSTYQKRLLQFKTHFE